MMQKRMEGYQLKTEKKIGEQRDLPSPTLSQASSPQRRKPPEGAEPEAADGRSTVEKPMP